MNNYLPPSYEHLVLEGTISRLYTVLPSYNDYLEIQQSNKNPITLKIHELPVILNSEGLPILSHSPLVETPININNNQINNNSIDKTITNEIILEKKSNYQEKSEDIPIYLQSNIIKDQYNIEKTDIILEPTVKLNNKETNNKPQIEIKKEKPIEDEQIPIINSPIKGISADPETNKHKNKDNKNKDKEVKKKPIKGISADPETNKHKNKDNNKNKGKNKDKDKEVKKKKGLRNRMGSFLKDARDLCTNILLPTPATMTQVHVYSPNSSNAKKKQIFEINDETLYNIGQECLKLTNEYRESINVTNSNLQWSEEIYFIACKHSLDMSEGTVPFGHAGFKERVTDFPFTSYRSAENVFYCSDRNPKLVAKFAIDSWIKSPGHQANLVGNFDTCSIGVCRGKDSYYFTQLFAKREMF